MIFADWDGASIRNLREDVCSLPPQRCRVCSKPKFLCRCDTFAPDGGCLCIGPHYDPDQGCKRVVLSAIPPDGAAGPWGYDVATSLAVPNAKNTRLLREAELDRLLADRERIVRRRTAIEAAGKNAMADVALVAELDKNIAEALNALCA